MGGAVSEDQAVSEAVTIDPAGATASDDIDQADQSAPATEVDPAAPWGINPRTGRPYKRDPALFEHLRKPGSRNERRRAERRRDRPAAAPRQDQKGPGRGAPARSPRAAAVQSYGERAVALVAAGTTLIPDPVDRAIVRARLPELAVLVDRLCAEYPAIAEAAERFLFRMTGGAWGDVAMWAVGTAGALALNHGYAHPLLLAMFGGVLDQARAEAAEELAAVEAMRAQFAAGGAAEEYAAMAADFEPVTRDERRQW